MLALDLALWARGIRSDGVAGTAPTLPPQPAPGLPALATPGASYHAVYSLSRLMAGYGGPLAYVRPAAGSPIDIGMNRADLSAADLPQPVTPVWGVYDQSGGGRDLQQPTSAAQPRLRAEATIGTRLALAFPGIAFDDATASLSGPQAIASVARSEFFLLDPGTSIQSAVWSEHARDGTVIRDAYVSGGTGTFEAGQADSGRHVHAGPQVVAIVERGAGDATLYLDGIAYPLSGGQDLGAATRVMLGASSFGRQFNASFRLGAYVAVAGAVSAADVAAVSAALLARFGVASDHAVNVVHIGDSIVQGIGAEDTLGPRAAIVPLLARRTRWWNLGIAGKALAACYADRARHEAVLLSPGKTNLALVDGGINDIGYGGGGQQLYAATTTPYVAALKAMGYKVGVVTLLPQASANYAQWCSDAAIEAERLAYNAAVRGNAAGADLIVDRAAEPRMGDPANCGDAALYSPTIGGAGIHPTALGYRLLAPIYAAAINAA